MPMAMKVTPGFRFRLVCYEDSPRGGGQWEITEATDTDTFRFPNDEIQSFDLTGEVGVHVEFFNAKKIDRENETWAEATITYEGQLIVVEDMNVTAFGYQHHKHPDHDRIRGKVSYIFVTKL